MTFCGGATLPPGAVVETGMRVPSGSEAVLDPAVEGVNAAAAEDDLSELSDRRRDFIVGGGVGADEREPRCAVRGEAELVRVLLERVVRARVLPPSGQPHRVLVDTFVEGGRLGASEPTAEGRLTKGQEALVAA